MLGALQDIVLTNILLHFEPSLWLWPWTQQSNFLTRHFDLEWCTFKPSLAAKGSVTFVAWQRAHSLKMYIFSCIVKLINDLFNLSCAFEITTSYDTVETQFNYINSNCGLDLDVCTPIILHDIPSHNDHHAYQIWLQKITWFRRYRPDKHSLTVWTFAVTLTLNTALQFYHMTLRLLVMWHITKSGCKRISSSEDTLERHILTM